MAAFGSSGGGERNPNNGMHPTGNSVNVMRKVGCLLRFFPAGDAGRSVLLALEDKCHKKQQLL